MKYIDAEKLIAEIKRLQKFSNSMSNNAANSNMRNFYDGEKDCCKQLLSFIDSLQQEQPDFPTTDEQMKEFLATNPKIEVPEKYKNPDWLFKNQEQLNKTEGIKENLEEIPSNVDLENEIDVCWQNWLSPSNQKEVEGVLPKTEFAMYARHFYELGRKGGK